MGGNGHPHYYTRGWQSHAHANIASGLELPPRWDDAALTSHAEPKGEWGVGQVTRVGCTNLGGLLLNRRPSREANASLADEWLWTQPPSTMLTEARSPYFYLSAYRKQALQHRCRGQR